MTKNVIIDKIGSIVLSKRPTFPDSLYPHGVRILDISDVIRDLATEFDEARSNDKGHALIPLSIIGDAIHVLSYYKNMEEQLVNLYNKQRYTGE